MFSTMVALAASAVLTHEVTIKGRTGQRSKHHHPRHGERAKNPSRHSLRLGTR